MLRARPRCVPYVSARTHEPETGARCWSPCPPCWEQLQVSAGLFTGKYDAATLRCVCVFVKVHTDADCCHLNVGSAALCERRGQ